MSFLKHLKAGSVPEPLIEKWKNDMGIEEFTDLKYTVILGDKKIWLEKEIENFQGWDIFKNDDEIWKIFVETVSSGYDIAHNVEAKVADIDYMDKAIDEKAKLNSRTQS